MKKLYLKYFLDRSINIFFCRYNNSLYLKNYCSVCFFFPSFFFFKNFNKSLSFMFNSVKNYYYFFRYLLLVFRSLAKIFFFKLKLRGLGYRIKRVTKNFYKFFFALNHFFYFFVNYSIWVKSKKRIFLVFSNNLSKLNDIFSHLIFLKKLDFYQRHNAFLVSKKILYIKKKK